MQAERAWRVLVVDDHPLMRAGLCALLHRVLPLASLAEAGSAAEAMERAAIQHPHLVLLDVNLPGANGLELARRLRETDRRVRMPMVAAETDPWVVQEALAAGASGFVAKTRTADGLAAAVQAVLSGGKNQVGHGRRGACSAQIRVFRGFYLVGETAEGADLRGQAGETATPISG